MINGISVGAIASIISSTFGLPLPMDFCILIATGLIGSTYAPYGDSTYIKETHYKNGATYRKISAECYITTTNGEKKFVENVVKYYTWVPGGP